MLIVQKIPATTQCNEYYQHSHTSSIIYRLTIVSKQTLCVFTITTCTISTCMLPVVMWLNGLVVSALGIQARAPEFGSRVAPLFHWLATLGKLFTHIASPVSHLQETGVQKGVFSA